MPASPLEYTTTTVTGSPATNAETIIATSPGVVLRYPGQTIKVYGSVNFTVGTSGTAGTLKLRRDSVTGTQIGVSVTIPVSQITATQTADGVIAAFDTPGDVNGQIYVMTLTVTAGAATSTVNNVWLSCRAD